MKKIIKLNENDLHKIIKNTIGAILNESSSYELIKGKFGEVTYLELFDKYILEYGNEVYYSPYNNNYQHFGNQGWERKSFKDYKDLKTFCLTNGIKIIKTHQINHSLAKGLPDCRSISDDMAKYL